MSAWPDFATIAPQSHAGGLMDGAGLASPAGPLGPLDPVVSVPTVRRHVASFFDRQLR